jgi:hypothetical protein
VDHVFAIAARDELWSGGVLLESRTSHGEARCRGNEIDADDRRDTLLVDLAESRMAAMRELAREMSDARIRLVASARRVNGMHREEASMSITIGFVSIVTTPEHAIADSELLRGSGVRRPRRRSGLPDQSGGMAALQMLWQNGSAAVLLHEAAGHAAEHDHEPLQWPPWLTIRDEPDFAFDDAGNQTRPADLNQESPKCLRRETFRDIPLPRMTNLIARQTNAPWSLPDERIDVHFIAGGAYEPLTEVVTISIASADLVRRGESIPLAPFHIRVPRARIARALAGASGGPLRYPGVVCAREGQEVVVGSFAPVMLTTELM